MLFDEFAKIGSASREQAVVLACRPKMLHAAVAMMVEHEARASAPHARGMGRLPEKSLRRVGRTLGQPGPWQKRLKRSGRPDFGKLIATAALVGDISYQCALMSRGIAIGGGVRKCRLAYLSIIRCRVTRDGQFTQFGECDVSAIFSARHAPDPVDDCGLYILKFCPVPCPRQRPAAKCRPHNFKALHGG